MFVHRCLLIVCCAPFVECCLLCVAGCLSPGVCCLLFVVCCRLLCVEQCLLVLVVCWLLLACLCLLPVAVCFLSVLCCLWFDICCLFFCLLHCRLVINARGISLRRQQQCVMNHDVHHSTASSTVRVWAGARALEPAARTSMGLDTRSDTKTNQSGTRDQMSCS